MIDSNLTWRKLTIWWERRFATFLSDSLHCKNLVAWNKYIESSPWATWSIQFLLNQIKMSKWFENYKRFQKEVVNLPKTHFESLIVEEKWAYDELLLNGYLMNRWRIESYMHKQWDFLKHRTLLLVQLEPWNFHLKI